LEVECGANNSTSYKVPCYKTSRKGMPDGKQWTEENGRGYVKQPRIFMNCRVTEEEEEEEEIY